MKLKFFFANFQILGPLECQGWMVIPQNVKKVKITAPYCTMIEKKNFPHISGNSDRIGRKFIYEEGLPYTLQRQNAENLKQIFPEKEYRGLSPNFHIHVSVSKLYIPTMGLTVHATKRSITQN